ncbi:recombinase family protein [Lactiplantibacillus plantarum]|uniref:recombinase family protein n=1 Tax=Lactiplantibacillus plantarum TaxID=1590 RepID=UPI0008269860|nr:recombinase family protein [Lactiplantibacillus plantarum]MCG0631644.1 DNA invertase Pin [Lactiplantibacillus plantarum]QDJ21574.1 DNA invertase Pin [Lactiplantibacillus plantarum]RXE75896.1 recombinase family protein [Lactiplantibacillus plantarum]GJI54622.1 recombinase family protein [Lactiplantibacillus plantarum]
MRVGYARVSSTDQNLDRQIEALKQANVTKIFQEKTSGKDIQRQQLIKLFDYIKKEDEVVVLSLDRLGRNSRDLTEIIEIIRRKGAFLNILDLPSFDGIQDPTLKVLLTNLVLEIQKYIAETERKSIRERQRQGIQAAKKRGVYRGRSPEYTLESKNPRKKAIYKKIVSILTTNSEGKSVTITEIAKNTGVSRSTIYKIKNNLNNES